MLDNNSEANLIQSVIESGLLNYEMNQEAPNPMIDASATGDSVLTNEERENVADKFGSTTAASHKTNDVDKNDANDADNIIDKFL